MMNRWIKPVGFVSVTALMASAAPSHTPTLIDQLAVDQPDNMLSVMTYNVHGLPWPVAQDRDDALVQIGARLAQMRQAALAAGRDDLVSMWAGQIAPNLRHRNAALLMQALREGLSSPHLDR